MNTGGYDIVAQVSESMINKSLAIAYYLARFPPLKDKYVLPVNVPENLKDFAEMNYEISITEPPTYKAQTNGAAQLTLKGKAEITVLGGIQVGTDAEIKISLVPAFDRHDRTLGINFADSVIENLSLRGFSNVAEGTTEHLQSLLSQSITKYLAETVGSVDLTPSILADEGPMGLRLENLGITASVFNVVGNVLGRQGGSFDQISNFCQDNHIAVAVTADALHRVYDNWWNQTSIPRIMQRSISHTFNFNFYPDWVETIDDWISEIALGGLFSVDVDIKGIKIGLTATMAFSKFSFELKANDRIEVSGSLLLDVAGDVDAFGTERTRVLIYTNQEKITKNLFHVDILALPIVVSSAIAELGIDHQNRLAIKIKEVHARIPLQMAVPDFITKYVQDQILSFIGEFVGSIPLTPSVITQKLGETDLTLEAKVDSFKSGRQEAILGIKTKVRGAGDYAPYVCNKNKRHLEVHKRTCKWSQKILPKNRTYYIDFQEALDDGYDGCSYCLPDYHTR